MIQAGPLRKVEYTYEVILISTGNDSIHGIGELIGWFSVLVSVHPLKWDYVGSTENKKSKNVWASIHKHGLV